jgi:LmbE family N-acetylglucosaminyl deacetylase
MNKINSIFKILLSLHYIDGFLGDIYRNLYSLKMHGFVPRLDCQGHSKVAVFAPHPDDEVIGAMGAIYGHRMAKSDICMIFCTPKKVDAMRRKEAERASKIMDVRTHFLGWEERFFPELTEAAEDICTILSTEKPDIIYIPSPVDPNPDHVLLNRILYYIWNADLIPRPMEIRLYGVLAPIPMR